MRKSVCVLALIVAGVASCSRDPESAKREFLANGNRYLAEKKYAQAIVEYRNALKQDPKFGDAHLKLTDVYIAAGDTRNAIVESVRAADALPNSVDAQMRAGTLLLLSHQYPEAKDRAVAALQQDPKNARALILLGNALAGLKDLDSAIQELDQAIDQDPQLTFSYTNLAALYAAKGDKEAAEHAFQSAVMVAPNSADAHLAYANFLWSEKKAQDAERELKAAAAIDAKSVAVNRALATFYMSQNRPADARTYFETYAEAMGTVEARLMLADYYVGQKNVAAATPLLNQVATDGRGRSRATTRLAMLDFRNGRHPDAYRRLEELLKAQPKDQDALQAKTRFLMLERRNQEALRVTDQLLAIAADSAINQYLRGYALELNGSRDDAIKAYLEVLKLNPNAFAAQARLSAVYLQQRRNREALTYAQQVVSAQPQSVAAHFAYAQALFETGDLARAEQELVLLSKATPSSPDIPLWLGRVYENRHDLGRARQFYQRAFDMQPDGLGALAGLMSVDFAEKKPAAALGRIQAQLTKKPQDIRLLSLYGLAQLQTRDFSHAAETYQKIIDASPGNLDAYGKLAGIYVAQNRLDEAKARYEEIVKRQPKSVAAETMLGMILAHQNNNAEATKHFEQALLADPRTPVAANNLAWLYANNGGNLDLALQYAQTAKSVLPDDASVTDTLGWVYYKKGLASVAVTTFRQAAALDAKNPNIQYHLGLALVQQGEKALARKALEEAARMKPSFSAEDEFKRAMADTAAS
jgi:tetratricopeptide (TPR) repeat protein